MTDSRMWETAYLDYLSLTVRETILSHKGGMLCFTIIGTEDAMQWRASVSRGSRTGPKVLSIGDGATPALALANLKRVR